MKDFVLNLFKKTPSKNKKRILGGAVATIVTTLLIEIGKEHGVSPELVENTKESSEVVVSTGKEVIDSVRGLNITQIVILVLGVIFSLNQQSKVEE